MDSHRWYTARLLVSWPQYAVVATLTPYWALLCYTAAPVSEYAKSVRIWFMSGIKSKPGYWGGLTALWHHVGSI